MLDATTSPQPLIEVRGLRKHFGSLEAVKGVDLHLMPGECLGLLGPNGAGKTTTIEMMEQILPPTAGEIMFRGESLANRKAARQFRASSGIAFQHTALQDHLTVADNLRLFRTLYDAGAALDELIELCALTPLLDRDARKLSGGQRQRLLLAMALVNAPDLVFLDEPTTGLDPQARRNFWMLLRKIKARGTAVLLTTHYMDEALELCDRLCIMDHGTVIADGTPQALLASTFAERVARLPAADLPGDAREAAARLCTVRAAEPGWIELLTDDLDALVDCLRAQRVSLRALQVRDRTLEDLFIHLTGQELRED